MAKQLSPSDTERLKNLVKRLPTYLRLAKSILQDPSVPLSSKVLLGAGGAYALSPIDLVPGVIPVAGQLDDAYALLFGLRQCLNTMPPERATWHLTEVGVDPAHIDDDLDLVVSIAGRIARMVVTTGARLGRAGKGSFKFAADRIRQWRDK